MLLLLLLLAEADEEAEDALKVGEAASVMVCCGGVLLRDEEDERMRGPVDDGRYDEYGADETERDSVPADEEPASCGLRLSPLLPATAVGAAVSCSAGRGGGERVLYDDEGKEVAAVLSAATGLGDGCAVVPLPFMRVHQSTRTAMEPCCERYCKVRLQARGSYSDDVFPTGRAEDGLLMSATKCRLLC